MPTYIWIEIEKESPNDEQYSVLYENFFVTQSLIEVTTSTSTQRQPIKYGKQIIKTSMTTTMPHRQQRREREKREFCMHTRQYIYI